MDRRHFLGAGLAAAAALASGGCRTVSTGQQALASNRQRLDLPRWRGFNLLEKFTDRRNAPYVEDDFRMMADWGFNFVRLPMSYWCWSTPDDPFTVDESVIAEVDQAVAFGEAHGVHVNLNLHRAPGYCVNAPEEPMNLWTDARAQDAFLHQWTFFAERYRDYGSDQVSFDLLNEPANVGERPYASVMRRAIRAIRDVDPDRLIIVDGLRYGREPVPLLLDTGVWQSTRGYDPMVLSHFHANWINRDTWPERLSWPFTENGVTYDRAFLRNAIIGPWLPLTKAGLTVHVGEWGAYHHTPHDVALAWMRDFLELWQAQGWGWALWNFRGSFGILDSDRNDIAYASVGGHRLDRAMLDLLQAY